jgi:methionine synthase reductase
MMIGLGDSNYDSYQGFPSALQTKMIELGAKEFYGRGKADEATGLEAVVEPWITDLWGDLAAFVEAQAAKPVELAPVAVSAGGAEPTAVPAATATPTPVAGMFIV